MDSQAKIMQVIKIDGRVKIPLKFAKLIINEQTGEPYDKSHIVRVNQGKRQLSEDAAIQVLELFRVHGVHLHLVDILPRLKKLRPYLCTPCKEQE